METDTQTTAFAQEADAVLCGICCSLKQLEVKKKSLTCGNEIYQKNDQITIVNIFITLMHVFPKTLAETDKIPRRKHSAIYRQLISVVAFLFAIFDFIYVATYFKVNSTS